MQSRCGSEIVPKNPLDNETEFICMGCSKLVKEEDARMILNSAEKIISSHANEEVILKRYTFSIEWQF